MWLPCACCQVHAAPKHSALLSQPRQRTHMCCIVYLAGVSARQLCQDGRSLLGLQRILMLYLQVSKANTSARVQCQRITTGKNELRAYHPHCGAVQAPMNVHGAM